MRLVFRQNIGDCICRRPAQLSGMCRSGRGGLRGPELQEIIRVLVGIGDGDRRLDRLPIMFAAARYLVGVMVLMKSLQEMLVHASSPIDRDNGRATIFGAFAGHGPKGKPEVTTYHPLCRQRQAAVIETTETLQRRICAMSFLLNQASALLRANLNLGSKLVELARASGDDWAEASGNAIAGFWSRTPTSGQPKAGEDFAGANGTVPASAPPLAGVERKWKRHAEEAGEAFADWERACVSVVTGANDSADRFVRYSPWAWLPAKPDGENE
jgi:hypothetical protein